MISAVYNGELVISILVKACQARQGQWLNAWSLSTSFLNYLPLEDVRFSAAPNHSVTQAGGKGCCCRAEPR